MNPENSVDVPKDHDILETVVLDYTERPSSAKLVVGWAIAADLLRNPHVFLPLLNLQFHVVKVVWTGGSGVKPRFVCSDYSDASQRARNLCRGPYRWREFVIENGTIRLDSQIRDSESTSEMTTLLNVPYYTASYDGLGEHLQIEKMVRDTVSYSIRDALVLGVGSVKFSFPSEAAMGILDTFLDLLRDTRGYIVNKKSKTVKVTQCSGVMNVDRIYVEPTYRHLPLPLDPPTPAKCRFISSAVYASVFETMTTTTTTLTGVRSSGSMLFEIPKCHVLASVVVKSAPTVVSKLTLGIGSAMNSWVTAHNYDWETKSVVFNLNLPLFLTNAKTKITLRTDADLTIQVTTGTLTDAARGSALMDPWARKFFCLCRSDIGKLSSVGHILVLGDDDAVISDCPRVPKDTKASDVVTYEQVLGTLTLDDGLKFRVHCPPSAFMDPSKTLSVADARVILKRFLSPMRVDDYLGSE